MRIVAGDLDQAAIDRRQAKAALLVNDIAGMTPAQADAWIDANVTTMETVREALKRLAHAAIALARLAE